MRMRIEITSNEAATNLQTPKGYRLPWLLVEAGLTEKGYPIWVTGINLSHMVDLWAT